MFVVYMLTGHLHFIVIDYQINYRTWLEINTYNLQSPHQTMTTTAFVLNMFQVILFMYGF